MESALSSNLSPALHGALAVHAALALLALWPALRLLGRAGLPRAWAAWLLLPLAGWPVFATLLAFRPWPSLPPRPEKLHSREALRRANADTVARRKAAGLEDR